MSVADIAVTPHHMVIQTILLRQITQWEDIVAEARLGILSDKDALMALVPEAIHGTDQNAYPLLPLVIWGAVATIIILPINPIVDPDIIGMVIVAFVQVLLTLMVLVQA
jgi:hypothetical protein